MRKVSSKALGRTAALVASSAAVLFAAACGGGSSDDSSGGGQNGGGNAAFTAYVECMSKNGVTITMPSRGARTGASRGTGEGFPDGDRPSGLPRPSGSAFPGGGGFPGGGFPGGGFPKPAGVDDATWQKAQEACASVRPSFGGNRGGGNGSSAAYQNCLEEHGVTSGTGTLDPNDATVKKALETCKVLQPQASATPSA